VANAHLAEQQGLKVIPVINKIDLPSANLELCMRSWRTSSRFPPRRPSSPAASPASASRTSSRPWSTRVPAPRWTDYPDARALVFDSKYDAYRGVISYARVFSGTSRPAR
jgi:GTP-binding protein LepA